MDAPPPETAPPPLQAPPATGVAAWLPGWWVLRTYRPEWLPQDVTAGLVLTALLVPAGMGYAEASGLPPVTGLYATVAPLLAYALFGPSPILVFGPDSALAPLVAAAVLAPAAGDPARAVASAQMLAILTGLLCGLAGVLRAGAVTELLSRPVRVGYANGIALTVLVSQLPKLFGFPVAGDHVVDLSWAFLEGLLSGRTSIPALAIGLCCLALVVEGRRRAPRVPWVLVAVAGATAAVGLLGLRDELRVVGAVPRGIPVPSLPRVGLADLGDLFGAAAGIALVSFADTSVLSRSLAARHRYRIDADRELFALAAANVAAGLVQGFPVSSSSSRTPVAEAAGARTQVVGVVGALAIVLLLVAAPSLLEDLPTTALAAIVLSAALRLFDLRSLEVFARVRRADFVLCVATFVGVVALGVLGGVVLAVTLSLLDFVRRAWRPHHAILGRAPGVKGYHDVTRYPDAAQVPGLLLFRWDAPLFFANADGFRERLLGALEAAGGARWVVVAAEPITDVDTTAAEMLEELDRELGLRGAELAFAELKDPVRDRLVRYGLQERLGREFFFPTIGVAVKAYLARTGTVWSDWEQAE
jgi:high affinity sulfate transporter 1